MKNIKLACTALLCLSLLIPVAFAQTTALPTVVELQSEKYFVAGDMLVDLPPSGLSPQLFSPEGAFWIDFEKWTDGVLPIVFDDDVSSEQRALFWDACREWEKAARIRCQDGPYQGVHLRVSASGPLGTGGCWSMLGMGRYFLGMRRRITLSDGCWYKETIIHEIGHSLGLIHEHQRPDRDSYVSVYQNNVDEVFMGFTYKLNFKSQSAITLNPYDFLSIMHYDRKAFSKNGQDTIVPKERFAVYADQMGNSKTLSEGDKVAVAGIYGAHPKVPPKKKHKKSRRK